MPSGTYGIGKLDATACHRDGTPMEHAPLRKPHDGRSSCGPCCGNTGLMMKTHVRTSFPC